jgi:oxygen-dependent protoporphyrinogen oxidase
VRVAVVGGGIAGLSAAWDLRGSAEVTVLDPGPLGGCLRTEHFEGRPVDCGPDAFITRAPEGLALCAEVGVDDLVQPVAGRSLVWWRGKARALPDGLVLGAPRKLGPLARSGLLSPLGLVRAAADLVLPSSVPPTGDLSVRSLVASRFGAEVADRLVDPLVGGIHAGRSASLSAEATVPQLVSAARSSRSLLLGLRSLTPAGVGQGAVFSAPRRGMAALASALVESLRQAGVRFEPAAALSVERDGSRWRVEPDAERFDAVVLALPSSAAAGLLGEAAPAYLQRIRRASVVIATLGYRQLDVPEAVNGVLFPPDPSLLITACSFGSSKWPHWAEPGRTVLRLSAGRDGDRRAFELGDEQLVERLASDAARAVPGADQPDAWRVSRWPDSFPQYEVGHLRAVAGAEEEMARRLPGVALCGSSYHGAGVPACIASGRKAARRLVALAGERAPS